MHVDATENTAGLSATEERAPDTEREGFATGLPGNTTANVLGSGIVVILLALLASPDSDPLRQFGAGMMVDQTAGFLLAIAAGLAFATLNVTMGDHSNRLFWVICSAGFLLAAFNQMLQWHHQVGAWLATTSLGPTSAFGPWDELIFLASGTTALGFAILSSNELRRHDGMALHLMLAAAFFAAYLALSSTGSLSALAVIPQATLLVMACAAAALTMLCGLLSEVQRLRHEATACDACRPQATTESAEET